MSMRYNGNSISSISNSSGLTLHAIVPSFEDLVFSLDLVPVGNNLKLVLSKSGPTIAASDISFITDICVLEYIAESLDRIIATNCGECAIHIANINHTTGGQIEIFCTIDASRVVYLKISSTYMEMAKFPLPDDISKYISDLEELYNKLKVTD